jgi:molecular chaperone GrpE
MPHKKKHDEEEVIDMGDGLTLESEASTVDDTDAELGDMGAALVRIKKLKSELAATKAEKQEYLDGWQRLKADVANMRKMDGERQKRGNEVAQEQLLAELLPIMDGFDMARRGNGWQNVDPNWRIGVEAIIGQLERLLAQYGAIRIGAIGEGFDPQIHEAASEREPEAGEPDGTVVAILRSGWKMGERVLRPAQVQIVHKKSH